MTDLFSPASAKLAELEARLAAVEARTQPPPAPEPAPPGPRVLFEDDFDGTKLDPAKWVSGFTSWGTPTNGDEFQAFSPGGAIVGSDRLHLIATRQQLYGKQYVSGSVHTNGLFEFTYGAVEIRARYPAGAGFWPGLWLLHDRGRNSAGQIRQGTSEIDILEVMGISPDYVYQTYHHYTQDGQDARQIRNKAMPPGFHREWHVYQLLWTASGIQWSIDGQVTGVVTTNDCPISDQPHHIIMDLSLGGWQVNKGGVWVRNVPDASTPLPAALEIDYVRVTALEDA